MKNLDAKHYLLRISINRSNVPSFEEYPYCLPVCLNMNELEFPPGGNLSGGGKWNG